MRSGTSSVLFAASIQTGDLVGFSPPFTCDTLTISPSARVYMVDGPESWNQLCLAYPARYGASQMTLESAAFGQALIVPDYAEVAKDWDGVHITLGGLFTTDQVRIDTDNGWTMLWGFDAEMCVWLHPVWEDAAPVVLDEDTVESWQRAFQYW